MDFSQKMTNVSHVKKDVKIVQMIKNAQRVCLIMLRSKIKLAQDFALINNMNKINYANHVKKIVYPVIKTNVTNAKINLRFSNRYV